MSGPHEDGQEDLGEIFNEIDNWFDEFRNDKPLSRIDSNQKDPDKIKLALISRTTTNWFKPLTYPKITNEGIGDSSSSCNSSDEDIDGSGGSADELDDPNLDSMAKDLELLLEGYKKEDLAENVDGKTSEPRNKYYIFDVYSCDETSLLDESIGHCCTIDGSGVLNHKAKRRRGNSKLTTNESNNHRRELRISSQSSVMSQYYPTATAATVQGNSLNFNSATRGDHQLHGPFHNSNQAQHKQQQTQQDNEELKSIVLTPMVPDHEYLLMPRPTKPLALSNRSWLRREVKTKWDSPIVNTGAIKRFARFSNRFKTLALKHENSNAHLLAVENT